jgi:hypothetical protein
MWKTHFQTLTTRYNNVVDFFKTIQKTPLLFEKMGKIIKKEVFLLLFKDCDTFNL